MNITEINNYFSCERCIFYSKITVYWYVFQEQCTNYFNKNPKFNGIFCPYFVEEKTHKTFKTGF